MVKQVLADFLIANGDAGIVVDVENHYIVGEWGVNKFSKVVDRYSFQDGIGSAEGKGRRNGPRIFSPAAPRVFTNTLNDACLQGVLMDVAQ